MNECMSVDATSESSERRTRRNWRSWEKHLQLTMDAWFSRHKSGMNVTSRRHAELEVSITSVPSINRGPSSVSRPRLCLVPVHNSSVCLGLILDGLPTSNVLYAAIQYIPRRCNVVKVAVDIELRVIGESI